MSRNIVHGHKDVRAIEALLNYDELKAPYSSKIDILLFKKDSINWFMVLIQS